MNTRFQDKSCQVELELVKVAPDRKLFMGCLKSIGDRVGLTRERVRQIAKKAGYQMPWTTAKLKRWGICKNCNKKFHKKYLDQIVHTKCNKKYHQKIYFKSIDCKICGKKVTFRRCYYLGEPVVCRDCRPEYCGKVISVMLAKSPEDRKELSADFPSVFTEKEFRKRYYYAHKSGGYIRLQRLVELGIVKKIRTGFGVGKNIGRKPDLYVVIRKRGKK